MTKPDPKDPNYKAPSDETNTAERRDDKATDTGRPVQPNRPHEDGPSE